MAFRLSIHPWVHIAKFSGGAWTGEYIEQTHMSPEEERRLDERSRSELVDARNHIPGFPLVNYTTQYGLGCFEGLKAFPQPDGNLRLFRPDRNCTRMAGSMKGLLMPPIDEKLLLDGIVGIVGRNRALGFTPVYNRDWEAGFWQAGDTVYVRPFTYSESGIGVNTSKEPWVVTVCTTVSAYFDPGRNNAVISNRIRATPNGTGWIKTAANYVTSILAKTEALNAGYMEAIFLDSTTRKCIEEGSSCNFFAVFPGDVLVTPALGDTILPGITRESIITMARSRGMDVREEALPIGRVMDEALECFVTGTAAGITPLGSLTHQQRTREFSSLSGDSISTSLLKELKGIQFGAIEDRFGWMLGV